MYMEPKYTKLSYLSRNLTSSILSCSASSSLPQFGDCILTALSGKRNRVAQKKSDDGLNPTSVPACVMDATDVETVVDTSEWAVIELHADRTGDDNSEDGGDPLPDADCHQRESRSNGNPGGSYYSGEPELTHNKHGGDVGCTGHRTAEAQQQERNAKERLSLSCSVAPPQESTLAVSVTTADGAATFTVAAATRRSARKPKKTWKLNLVNLQKQKRKPSLVTGPKRERKPLALMRTSEAVTETDGEHAASGNRSVHGFN